MPTKSQADPGLPSLNDLVDAGAHFGHRRSRSHPKSRKFVYTIRDRVLVINLEATQEKLQEAATATETLAAEGCQFLFVGTKPQAKAAIEKAASEVGMPYVTHRWLGGTLTNYETIRANLQKLDRHDEVMTGQEFEQFSKKERGRITKERDKLQKIFGGIRTMTMLPGALVIVDVAQESIAVAEANRLGLPIIAVVDTNADPSQITYPIPANDDSRRTIELMLNVLTSAIARGAVRAPKPVVPVITAETTASSVPTATQGVSAPAVETGFKVLPTAPAMPIDDTATGSTAERLAQALGTPTGEVESTEQEVGETVESVPAAETVKKTTTKKAATKKNAKKPSKSTK